ncbi:MFS transporter [Sporosarcina pasteurii]|uniref:Multidrug resistance protein MdtH n=1 Tax=Sporosarcina pasteurii TaxID=1474 RepID=A0A380C8C5_SPOPA|nr:MFS transporter [Sporosarcina pasteurii]MDS9471795.1 MFS transporter [Sporosarcina pasteurii]QBQ04611.1 MFS transporter [Sporosarcina pasteurii]SUJ13814.1 multidrug resistance protein MdtH [Sporosarcina pasteurii]
MPRAVWLLVIGMLVNVTGNSFLWPLNTIYIHDYLGKSLTVAGFVLMANQGAGVIGNLLGGFLFDRIGAYKSILGGIGLSILALICLVFWNDWPTYVWLLMVLGFSGGIIFPSMYAMIGSVWPDGGRKAFNTLYLSQNVGVAIGPSLAGLVASINIHYIFTANLFFYAIFFFIAFFGYKNMETAPELHTNVLKEQEKITDKAPFYALLIITGGYLLTWIIYSQWSTTISTFALDLGVSLRQYSLIWTINGLLIVLGQPLIRPIIKRLEHKIKTQMLIGIFIFIISFTVVAYAGSFKMFVAAMVIVTFGEMLIWPAIPTIANQLAPRGREGFYQGIVNSTATIGRMIGPVAGGILVDLYDMRVMIFILITLMSLAIITTLVYDRPIKKAGYSLKSE